MTEEQAREWHHYATACMQAYSALEASAELRHALQNKTEATKQVAAVGGSPLGHIKVVRNGDDLTFVWVGDDIVLISLESLRDSDRRYVTYAKFPDAVGDQFTLGPYLLEVTAVEQNHIYVRRV